MSNAKHTPGPWEVARKVSNYVVARGGLDIICQCDTMSEAKRSVENANARLISAAPDLLAALVALEEQVTAIGMNGTAQQVMQARAAIAKAKQKT